MVQDGQVRCQQRLEPAWREGGHLRSLGDPCSEPRASFFAGPAAFLGLPRSTSRRRSSSAVLIRRCVAPAFLAARAWRVCQFSERAKPTGYAARVDSRSWSRRPLADAAPPVRARRSDRARRTTARRASPRGAAAVGTRRAIFEKFLNERLRDRSTAVFLISLCTLNTFRTYTRRALSPPRA